MRNFNGFFIFVIAYFNILNSCETVNRKGFNFYNNEYIGIDTLSITDYKKYQAKNTFEDLDTTLKYSAIYDTLKLPLDNGGNVVMIDTLVGTDDPSIRTHEYLGIYKNINYYLVLVRYYESGEYYLINKSNGIKYKIICYPIISPDKKYFVSTSAYLNYDVMPTGIELWKIKSDTLEQQFLILFEHFEIEEANWVNNDGLIIKIGLEDGNNIYGKLQIKN
jgi:hypothetical protein